MLASGLELIAGVRAFRAAVEVGGSKYAKREKGRLPAPPVLFLPPPYELLLEAIESD